MADCTCIWEPQPGSCYLKRVITNPRCPVHYAPIPQYDQAGRLRPDGERDPEEGKHGGCG